MSEGAPNASAGATVVEVAPDRALALLRGTAAPVLVDVREDVEWDEVHLDGASHLPLARVVAEIASIVPDRASPVLLYCAHGVRSRAAAESLVGLGYAQVSSLAGGIAAWEAVGLPVVHGRTATLDRA